jgi:hypothetical protein
VSELKHVYSLPDPARKADDEIQAMRERVLAEVARIKADQQPLARTRHEKKLNECLARCDADLARALEMSRRLTQQPVREAA